jgi:hypothetical protein
VVRFRINSRVWGCLVSRFSGALAYLPKGLVCSRSPCFDPLKKFGEFFAIKAPVERAGISIREFLVQQQTTLHICEISEVVRGEYLPLHQREIDLDLIEPTRMNWRMKQDQVRVSLGQASDCGLSTMRRAVVDHPEDAFRGTVGLVTHDLSDRTDRSASPRRRTGRSRSQAHSGC